MLTEIFSLFILNGVYYCVDLPLRIYSVTQVIYPVIDVEFFRCFLLQSLLDPVKSGLSVNK